MVLALSYSKLAFNFLGYLKKIFVIFLEQHDWVASPPIRGSGYIKLKKKWCIFLNHCWIAVLWLPSTFHRRFFKEVTYFYLLTDSCASFGFPCAFLFFSFLFFSFALKSLRTLLLFASWQLHKFRLALAFLFFIFYFLFLFWREKSHLKLC